MKGLLYQMQVSDATPESITLVAAFKNHISISVNLWDTLLSPERRKELD